MSKPRLSIDLTKEQAEGLKKHLPHGSKKMIFHLFIDSFLEICEKHGAGKVIGALIARAITVGDIAKIKLEEES